MNLKIMIVLVAVAIFRGEAQDTVFDFENAPIHISLPLNLTVGGITAQFSATGQGFSIQPANTMGFTPVSFSGNCIYPNSIYASDLLVSFSMPLTDLSILYAPQELACDSSATMRVTAYLNGALIGSATTNAQPGTWPSDILAFSSSQTFDRVVVHYDKPPVTGGDWGPIFMADNMKVTAAPAPVVLTKAILLPNGEFQFTFSSGPGLAFSVVASSDPSLSLTSWTALGQATEMSTGQYQFTDQQARNSQRRFYRVHSP